MSWSDNLNKKVWNNILLYATGHVLIGAGASIRSGMGLKAAAIISAGCILQGTCAAVIEGRGISIYVNKFLSTIACALLIIAISHFCGADDVLIPMLNVAYLPVATGTMLVENTYKWKTEGGRKGMARALICSFAIACGYMVALMLRRIAYV